MRKVSPRLGLVLAILLAGSGTPLGGEPDITSAAIPVQVVKLGSFVIGPTFFASVHLAGAPTGRGTVFFNAGKATHGVELWKTDGTPAGTVLVKDIWPGANSCSPGFVQPT